MVGGDSMGSELQLVEARFSNFLLGKLSQEFDISPSSNGHISVLRDATVRWFNVLVDLHVLCMLM